MCVVLDKIVVNASGTQRISHSSSHAREQSSLFVAMAAGFPLRRNHRNRRQAQRSYRTFASVKPSVKVPLHLMNRRSIQVSSLNRVFEGVEGIDILQVRCRLCTQQLMASDVYFCTMNVACSSFNQETILNCSSYFCFSQRPDLVSVLPVAVAHPHANVRALACRHVCRFFADDEGIAFLRQVTVFLHIFSIFFISHASVSGI